MKDDPYAHDLTGAVWTTPCGGNINVDDDQESCMEWTALPGGGKAIRDTKRPDMEPMRFSAEEVTAFVGSI